MAKFLTKLEPASATINWDSIVGINWRDYEDGKKPMSEIEDMLDSALRFIIDPEDAHWKSADFSCALAKYYQRLLAQVDDEATGYLRDIKNKDLSLKDASDDLRRVRNQVDAAEEKKEAAEEMMKRFDEMQESQRQERERWSNQMKEMQRDMRAREKENNRLKEEYEEITKLRLRTERELEEERIAARERDRDASRHEVDQVQLSKEHRSLVIKVKELSEEKNRITTLYETLTNSADVDREHYDTARKELEQRGEAMRDEVMELCNARDEAMDALRLTEEKALANLQEVEKHYEALLAAEADKSQQLQDEIDRMQSLAPATSSRFFSGIGYNAEDDEEKDEMIGALRQEVEQLRGALAAAGGAPLGAEGSFAAASGLFGSGPAAATEMSKQLEQNRKLQTEVDQLSQELQLLEVRIEQRDTELMKTKKIVSDYESEDKGLKNMRKELIDSNRTIGQLNDESQHLRERLSLMDQIAGYCTALKALCKRLGVTDEELARLNSNAVQTETETLRSELGSLEDEVKWLEKERKHWMLRCRNKAIPDAEFRKKVGLSPEEEKKLDYIIEQIKAGTLVVEGYNDGYRDRYMKEVEERTHDKDTFKRILAESLQELTAHGGGHGLAIGTGSRPPGEGEGSSPLTADAVERLRTDISSLGGGDTLRQTVAEQTELIKSQTHRIEELSRELQERFGTIRRLEDQQTTADENVLSALSERDAYREAALANLGAPTPTRSETAPPRGTALSYQSPLQQSASGVSPTAGVLSSTTALESFVAVEVMLREQLATKTRSLDLQERRITQLSQSLEGEKKQRQEAESESAKMKQLKEQIEDHMEGLSEAVKNLEARTQELEKSNQDYEAVVKKPEFDHHRELLQKVALLRKREAKLLNRLRLMQTERDGAVERSKTTQAELDKTLNNFQLALNSGSTTDAEGELAGTSSAVLADKPLRVLPSTSGRVREEVELLHHMSKHLSVLTSDGRTAADETYVQNLRVVEEARSQQRGDSSLRSQLNTVKRQLDGANVTIATVEAERDGLLRQLSDANNGSPTGTGAESTTSLLTELETWKQKSALYLKQLSDREGDITQLTSDLETARGELGDTRQKNRDLASQLAAKESSAGSETAAARPASNSNPSPVEKAESVQRLEREIGRVKSINVGLLQSLIDTQTEKKIAQAEMESAQRQCQMLSETVKPTGEGLSELLSTALRDNAVLQQQLVLATHSAKKLRIQALTAEANCRVLANETQAYRLGAYRVYRHYGEDMAKAISFTKKLQRHEDSRLSLRQSTQLHEECLHANQRADSLMESYVTLQAKNYEISQQTVALKREVDLLRIAAGSENGTKDVDRQLLIETRGTARNAERRAAESEEEMAFVRMKLKRSGDYVKTLNDDISRLESTGGAFVTGGGDAEGLLRRLEELRETVIAKAEGVPPQAVTAATLGPVAPAADDAQAAEAIEGYHQAVTKQFDLQRQVTELQRQVNSVKQQLSLTETRSGAMKEELTRAEHRVTEASRALDDERERFRQREDRLLHAHKEQSDVMQRAAEHNSHCLKEVIASKERSISQLQQQLNTQRARHLEAALMDSTRMERLHEQLFRENNVMVERFKATIEQMSAPSSVPTPNGNVGADHPGNDASTRQAQHLTNEVLDLRVQVKELRVRNAALEQQLESQLQRAQMDLQQTGAGQTDAVRTAVANAEGSLLGITSDQAAVIDQLRRREHDLLAEVTRLNRQSEELMVQVRRLEQHGAGPFPTSSTGYPALGATPSSTAMPTSQHSSPLRQSHGGSEFHQLQKLHQEVHELRERIFSLQTELDLAKQEADRHLATRQTAEKEGAEFRTRADALTTDITQQRMEIEKAKDLQRNNDSLKTDVQGLTEQNEKLVSAMAFLRQKILEGAQEKNKQERQVSQEIAITQRVAAIQAESQAQLSQLKARIDSTQNELTRRVIREEDLLKKHEESKRGALLHRQQVVERDGIIAQLKRQVAALKEDQLKTHTQLRQVQSESKTLQQQLQQAKAKAPVATQPKSPVPAKVAIMKEASAQADTVPGTPPVSSASVVGSGCQVDPQKAVSPPSAIPGTSATTGANALSPPPPPATPITPPSLGATPAEADSSVPRAPSPIAPTSSLPTPAVAAPPPRPLENTVGVQTEAPSVADKVLTVTGSSIARQLREKQQEQESAIRNLQIANKKLQSELDETREKGEDSEKGKLAQQVKSLKAQLGETKQAAEKMEAAHKKEVLEFLEERKAARTRQVEGTKAETSSQVRNLRIANKNLLQQQDELKTSHEQEKHHLTGQIKLLNEQVRDLKKQLERVKSDAVRIAQGRSVGAGRSNGARATTAALSARTTENAATQSSPLTPPTATAPVTEASATAPAAQAPGTPAPGASPSSEAPKQDEAQPAPSQTATEQKETPPANPTLAAALAMQSPREAATHKQQILLLESEIDKLKRELRVEKQAEILSLQNQIERMRRDHREELLVLTHRAAGASPAGTVPSTETGGAPPGTTSPSEEASGGVAPTGSGGVAPTGVSTSSATLRGLEDKLLNAESTILDLRFERESLAMKADRLQHHIEDLMKTMQEGGRGPNVGASPPTAMAKASEKRSKQGAQVAALEGVIEQLKRVVHRLQKENVQLKENSVNSSKYVEALREAKILKVREKELVETVRALSTRLALQEAQMRPGGQLSEQSTSLQRRLRVAQNAADQYQLELAQLREKYHASATTSGNQQPSQVTSVQYPDPPQPRAPPYELSYAFASGSGASPTAQNTLLHPEGHRYQHHHRTAHEPSSHEFKLQPHILTRVPSPEERVSTAPPAGNKPPSHVDVFGPQMVHSPPGAPPVDNRPRVPPLPLGGSPPQGATSGAPLRMMAANNQGATKV